MKLTEFIKGLESFEPSATKTAATLGVTMTANGTRKGIIKVTTK